MNTIFSKLSISKLSSLHTKISNSFASKMQASSTSKTKDSAGRRLGVKKFGDEEVFPNDILIRQRGFKWRPGKNTFVGKDHTIHSQIEGKVKFETTFKKKHKTVTVNVESSENPNRTMRPPPPHCYHPELFPERALFNPEPTNYPMKINTPKNKNKITYWFGKKEETFEKYFVNIHLPEAEILQEPVPRLEFKLYNP